MKLTRSLSTYAECEAAISDLIPLGVRSIRIFDRYLETTWDRPARIEALRAFCLRAQRAELQLVLHDAGRLPRTCPRLVALLGRFAHVIAVRETRPEAHHAADPVVIVDDRHYFHRFHVDSPRASVGIDDPVHTQALRERFSELWEASDPVSPGSPLGL
ncbi:MAG: hypothetical protein GC151_02440 [Betaproteobacteria bacterium]|nr:hypothetical protein [Betaproteobacteria bacterium]